MELQQNDFFRRKGVNIPNVDDIIRKAVEENAKSLKLIKCFLQEIPSEVFGLEHLQTLDLSENNIAAIPPQIAQLKNLKTLVLRKNNISSLPEEIGELSNLSHLILGYNYLNDLPKSFARLQKLRELHLTSNLFTEIPDPIFELRELKVLWLTFNEIKEISGKISQLANLKTLYLKGNQLQEVPESLVRLEQLESVFLEGNPMYLTPLYDWTGNRLPQLRTYFSSLEDSSEKSYTAKLIFIGKGSEGKTTLAERLINPNITTEKLKAIKLTEGIEIKKLNNIYAEDNKNYDISMWDFGGQEILRNIHHLFLTDSALYILLWSSRSAENKYAYFKEWLSIVNAENPDSKVKVILIQNKAREEGAITDLIDQEKLKKIFPKLVDFINVSALEGAGIEELRRMIQNHLKDLPTVKKVSGKWIAIKSNIEKFKAQGKIEYEGFTTLCGKMKITDRQEVDQLLEWLHHIGAVLWYKSIPALRGTIYLDPEWVSKEVSRILIGKSESIRKKNGKFFIQDIIDENNSTPEKIYKVIQLMEEFNLCFELNKQDRSYIIPLLLKEKMPSEIKLSDWGKGSLDFKYQYALMPRGILAEFIAWAYREEKLDGENYWQNGVVLKHGDHARALVTYDLFEEDTAKEVIRIQVDGQKKEHLLEIIREHFDKKLNKRTKIERSLISCRGLSCQGGGKVFNYFDLNVLEEMSDQKIEAVQCHKCFKNIPMQVFNNFVESYCDERLSNMPANSKENKMNIFISYSHADSAFFEAFMSEFDNIAKSAQMEVFTDEGIPVGEHWDDYLKDKVSKCNIMILLVSSGFLGSDYIREKEFGEVLRRLSDGQRIRIIPVYFRPCDELGADLSKLQFFKPKGKIYGFDKKDFSFCDLVKFSDTNGRLIPNNNRHQYVIDLKKKILESWRALNNVD
ncbi:MAG TPA: COR domain-containing protein [Saprospiraceae bacterium]|nr:COR domain-containing protein [Saprospiraceae bacterium]